MIKLLLIEDDASLSYMIKSSLEDIIGNYEVDIATNGEEGLERIASFRPDMIVSDIEMPVLNGLEMLKQIRLTDTNIPVIFASGKVSSKDVTFGYEAGADNYIKKPFSPEELDAHIRSMLNLKNGSKTRIKNAIYPVGRYGFDPKNFTLTYESEKYIMTARESHLLDLLVEHKGEIVKREDILLRFWKLNNAYTSRSLDVFISRIRGYLSKDKSVTLKNIKGVGLVLNFD
jgi:DNA-binding response OmpR family regulator